MGSFEPCLGGVENLNRTCQIFPAEYTWLLKVVFGMEKFEGKEVTFVTWRMASKARAAKF